PRSPPHPVLITLGPRGSRRKAASDVRHRDLAGRDPARAAGGQRHRAGPGAGRVAALAKGAGADQPAAGAPGARRVAAGDHRRRGREGRQGGRVMLDLLLSDHYGALAPEHRADLERSGLTSPTIAAQKIRSVPPAMIPRLLGFDPKAVSA